jgi:serine/threonine protein kinase
LAVLFGRFPLDAPSNLTYWDLLRLICDEDSPEPGDAFSSELNMFINSCLGKDPHDRPSVVMLLQHPWFLTNSSVLTAWKKSRRNTFVASDLIVLDSDEDKPVEDDRGITARSDLDSVDGQSRLSKLTERTKSKNRSNSRTESELYDSTAAGSGSGYGSNAVCFGRGEVPPSEYEEDDVMTAVRLEHLQRILEKTDRRYDQMVAMYRREKQKRLSGGEEGGIGRSSRMADRSSFHSMRSSRSFLKAPSDPLIPLPNLYAPQGRRKWHHLAHQLHLPREVITNTAANIINQKYFAKSEI